MAGIVSSFEFIYRKYFPQLKSSAVPIAIMGDSQGSVKFRNAFDTIWLPSFKGGSIYSGDYIQTGSSSKARLYFGLASAKSTTQFQKTQRAQDGKESDKNYIDVLEDSFVKLSTDDGGLRIKLIEGDVVAVTEPKTFPVVIQRGSEDSVIKPISAEDLDKLEQLKKESKDSSTQNKEEKEKPINPVAFTTTPKNSSTLLFLKPRETFFEFGDSCPDLCDFKLMIGQNLIKNVTFKLGQRIRVELSVNDSNYGIYRWELETEHSKFKGEFSILPFSKENLERANKENVDMEVVF